MMTMRTTARKWRSKRMCPLENHKNSDLDTPPPPTPRPPHPTTIYKKGIRDRVWHFGFKTSRFRNFLIFFNDIGIGFGKFWSSQKYQGVAVLVWKYFWRNKKSSQKYIYQGVAMLVSANPEVLSKISRGGDAFFCWWPEILSKISRGGGACLKKGTKLMMMIRIMMMMMMFSIQLKDEYYSNINRNRIRIRIYSVEK